MKRRNFVRTAAAAPALGGLATPAAAANAGPARRNAPLSNDHVELWSSPERGRIGCGKAMLERLPDGRLVAGMMIGANGRERFGFREDEWGLWRGLLFTSDDHGRTWTERAAHPVNNGRLILNGEELWLIGGEDGMLAMRSRDRGETWQGPWRLVEDGIWYNEPTNHLFAGGRVYLAMNRITRRVRPADRGVYAPVVFSARVGDDWSRPQAWTISNVFTYHDAVAECGEPNAVGIPFYPYGFHSDSKHDRRPMYKIGWWEPNLVQIHDPNHLWHDPEGRTFQILQRAPVGKTNVAALCQASVAEDGAITVGLQRAPSGEPMIYVPFPGGHGMFNLQYDPRTKLYWLLSQQSVDSMRKIERLQPKRWNLGHHERHRFALHFSSNAVDWCFAGLLADAGDVGQSRHCASFVFDGEDLHWLSRSAGPEAGNAHDADMITFHTVPRFRELVY